MRRNRAVHSMRYFITLSYDGTPFSGWQIQENANSVQHEIQKALGILLKEPVIVTGAGRTDAGVNAIGYVAHFDSANILKNCPQLCYKLNAILPDEICVNEIFRMPDNAHARFDATSRCYKYYIHTRKDPFCTRHSCFTKADPDIAAMNRAAGYLLGVHDFSCFEKVNGGNKTSVCNVMEAGWEQIEEHRYLFTIRANRFLRNMVRAIVGSLLEVGYGKRPPEWIAEIMEMKERGKAGQSVPGNALFLAEITYPYPLGRQPKSSDPQ